MTDPDATGATPTSPTEPLPAAGPGPSGPRPPGTGGRRWRTWQVVAVGVATLVAGVAVGTVGALVADDDDDVETAAVTSTTSQASTTTSAAPTTTTRPPSTTDGSSGERSSDQEVREGQTVVGNSSSVFTGSYSSNRDKTTDEFTVEDDWTVRWEVDEGSVTVRVLDAGGDVVDTVEAEGNGEMTYPDGGTYRLEITTDGSRYTVVVTDGP